MIKAREDTKQTPTPTITTSSTKKTSSSMSAAQEEWTKIQDAAERRKIQNRNAQRKYRKNLKRRVEDLERQNAYMAFTAGTSNGISTAVTPATAGIDSHETSPMSDEQGLKIEVGRTPVSPKTPFDHPGALSGQDFMISPAPNDWMRHQGYIPAGTIQPSQTLANLSPRSVNLSTPSSIEHDHNSHLTPESMLNLSSLTDYIQHNNTILEESMGSPSSSQNGDDMQFGACNGCQSFCMTRGAATGGRTTLHLAAMRGFLPIVQMLLEKGMDVNARDNQGWTALHLAAERGQHAVVKLLLDRGADIYARI